MIPSGNGVLKAEFWKLSFSRQKTLEEHDKTHERVQETTTKNCNHKWHYTWEMNHGHTGVKQVLLSMCHPCSPIYQSTLYAPDYN